MDPLNSSIMETPASETPATPSSSSSTSTTALTPRRGSGAGQRVLLMEGVLDVVSTEGSISESSEYVVSLSLQLLADILALREGLYWPEFKEALAPLLPYIEVHT